MARSFQKKKKKSDGKAQWETEVSHFLRLWEDSAKDPMLQIWAMPWYSG
jgi:hypothetical protein